jgi:hypothetical protein
LTCCLLDVLSVVANIRSLSPGIYPPSRAKLTAQVASLDALALAPAAVQEAIQQRQEKQARGEAAWASMMTDTVGGGGTHLSTEVTCPSCGEKRAQVHTILSGGTYAQVREFTGVVATLGSCQHQRHAAPHACTPRLAFRSGCAHHPKAPCKQVRPCSASY